MSGTIGIQVRDEDRPEDLRERAQQSGWVQSGCYRLTGEMEDWFWPDSEYTDPTYRGKWRSRWFTYEQVCPCPHHR